MHDIPVPERTKVIGNAMELIRPRGITDHSWEAILHHKARLDRAWHVATDESAAIGAAKELCEAAARVILEERAVTYSQRDDMPKLVQAAHATLDRKPGRGQATQAAIRNLSQAALSIITTLYELRNQLGTGHGRARTPKVTLEVAVATSDAAILWTRWALARLDGVMGGSIDLLISDLHRESWTRGKLGKRFAEVDLHSLFADDQQRIGVAVAHRTMRNTVMVREGGVDPLLTHPEEWPEAYRLGITKGLLLTQDGHLTARPDLVPVLASIVTQMHKEDWLALSIEVGEAPLQLSVITDNSRRADIAASLKEALQDLPEYIRPGWDVLAGRFAEIE